MARMYPRSEFPTETFSVIVNAKGRVSLAAIRQRFSAYGCPNASAEIAAAAIKAGYPSHVAISSAMLAYYAKETMLEPIERTARAIVHAAERENAERHPFGKCAEDIRARREGRPSRWNTDKHHELVAEAEAARAAH